MNARQMQAITDNAIKDRIDALIELMRQEAILGRNYIEEDISEAEASWFERNGYTAEIVMFTPQKTTRRISW